MASTMSATQARIHFGELMRRVVDGGEAVVVERSGRPTVVVLSVEAHAALVGQRRDPGQWSDAREPTDQMVLRETGPAYEVADPQLPRDSQASARFEDVLADLLPDEVAERLRLAARRNRRNVGDEVLHRVEQSLRSHRVPAKVLARRVQQIHNGIEGQLDLEQIQAAKREGRP